jgi:ethanolamine utilization protein EutN
MIIGTVIGNVWATRKEESLVGIKFLIIQPEDMRGLSAGTPIVAVDRIGAGVGERVIVVQGCSSRYALQHYESPIDSAVIGIIDSVDMDFSLDKEGNV